MGVLDGAICYLAGPIDFDENLGVDYRKQIKEKCKDNDLKIKFLDPTHKIGNLVHDVGVEQDKIKELKTNKDWPNLRKMMKKIVKQDLRQVDLSDFIIVMIDTKVHMCGTYHELLTAEWQRKPILAICKGGKQNAPSWLFGILDHKYMFDTIDECLDHLVKLDRGESYLNRKWILFRKELDTLKD